MGLPYRHTKADISNIYLRFHPDTHEYQIQIDFIRAMTRCEEGQIYRSFLRNQIFYLNIFNFIIKHANITTVAPDEITYPIYNGFPIVICYSTNYNSIILEVIPREYVRDNRQWIRAAWIEEGNVHQTRKGDQLKSTIVDM